MKQKNLRTMTTSTSDGKDVTDTSQLKGEARPVPQSENETKQHYTSGGVPKDNLGGEDSAS